MRAIGSQSVLACWVIFAVLGACSARVEGDAGPSEVDGGHDSGAADANARPALAVFLLSPAHGSFRGDTEVVMEGAGLSREAAVHFGEGRATVVRAVDDTRLVVRTPPGPPGSVEVRVEFGGATARLANGFRYDPVDIEPSLGPVTGGTRISLTSASALFANGDEVTAGGQPCGALELVSALELRCTTPEHDAGSVDVEVRRVGAVLVRLENGFTYLDAPVGGGLSGGPIEGRLVVLASTAVGTPIEDAYVVVGNDPTTPHRGRTAADGRITFVGSELDGPLDVHVSHPCYHRFTYAGVDASSVTVPLEYRRLEPDCPGAGGLGPSDATGVVRGRILWRGDFEFDEWISRWTGLPSAGPGERRVVYIGPDPIPEPSSGDVFATYEIEAASVPQRIFAVAGIERSDGRFDPYVLGASEPVLPIAGAPTGYLDIRMSSPLTTRIEVDVPPYEGPLVTAIAGGGAGLGFGRVPAPNQVIAVVAYDVGTQYRLVPAQFRPWVGLPWDARGQVSLARVDVWPSLFEYEGYDFNPFAARGVGNGAHRFTFRGLPDPRTAPFVRALSLLVCRTTSPGTLNFPEAATCVRLDRVPDAAAPLVASDFLGIPDATSPRPLARYDVGDPLRWTLAGTPEIQRISIRPINPFPTPTPARGWDIVAAPAVREVRWPAVTGVEETEPLTRGLQHLLLLEAFDFDGLTFDTAELRTTRTQYPSRQSVNPVVFDTALGSSL